jgi:hypothetical protein
MNEKLARFVDENGKIIVSDDMPDNLKSAIDYLNRNNVGFFDEIVDDYNDDLDADEENEFSEVLDDDDDIDSDEELDDEEESEDDILESESGSSDLSDLSNLF